MEVWNIEDGLRLVRALQPECRRFGYHLALGGGVLNNGRSYKDIDLYFLPLDNPKESPTSLNGLRNWLDEMWGEGVSIAGKAYGKNESMVPLSEPDPVNQRAGALGWGRNIIVGRVQQAPPVLNRVDWENANVVVRGGDYGERPAAVPAEQLPPDVLVQGGPEPPENVLVNLDFLEAPAPPPSKPVGPYVAKMKFMRGDARIDVFVIG